MRSGSMRRPGDPRGADDTIRLPIMRRFTTRRSDNDAYGTNNVIFYQWFDSAVNGSLVERGLLDIQAGNPVALVAEMRCTI